MGGCLFLLHAFFFSAGASTSCLMANADGAAAPPITLTDFKPETIRGTPGFFRVGQTHAGVWWLIDPDDSAFFSRGVNAVARGVEFPAAPGEVPAEEMESAERHLVKRTQDSLRSWHVNTLGPRSAPEFAGRGFAETDNLEFINVAPQAALRLGGARVPDVFDPKWVEAVERRAAERCVWRGASAALIGYFTDEGLNWAQLPPENEPARVERPSLLQICLSLEPSFPAYHAAWEFVLAAHGSDWAMLMRAWDVDLPNKEALRQLTLAERALTSAGYRRDQERFSREFARRYFAATAGAIRRYDPHHLILGCNFGLAPAAAVIAECVSPHVDVLALSLPDPAMGERIDRDSRVQGMPVLASDFSWAHESFTIPVGPDEAEELTSVERMLSRGRRALERAFTHPALIGCAWADWSDAPGDVPPFGRGLVHVDGREAREHTELLSHLYARAETLRATRPYFNSP